MLPDSSNVANRPPGAPPFGSTASQYHGQVSCGRLASSASQPPSFAIRVAKLAALGADLYLPGSSGCRLRNSGHSPSSLPVPLPWRPSPETQEGRHHWRGRLGLPWVRPGGKAQLCGGGSLQLHRSAGQRLRPVLEASPRGRAGPAPARRPLGAHCRRRRLRGSGPQPGCPAQPGCRPLAAKNVLPACAGAGRRRPRSSC